MPEPVTVTAPRVRIMATYCFVALPDPVAVGQRLAASCRAAGVKGTLILAAEGYNGTLAGPPDGIAELALLLAELAGAARAGVKYAEAPAMPFGKLKVKVKPEIVTMGVPGLDAAAGGGTLVAPGDWNALIADPATLVVDTRNAYEVGIGSFAGAIDPATRSFADFPDWLAALAAGMSEAERQERPLAMFCTGGIRCEKATALARSLGFGRVHHLAGGILAYLEQVEAHDSLWRGACFVFDGRVAVGQDLMPDGHGLCGACGQPVPADASAKHACPAARPDKVTTD